MNGKQAVINQLVVKSPHNHTAAPGVKIAVAGFHSGEDDSLTIAAAEQRDVQAKEID